MYIDEIKGFTKNDKELGTLTHVIRIYSQHIVIKFGMLIMKSGKRETMERIELQNQTSIRTQEKKGKLQEFENIGNGRHEKKTDRQFVSVKEWERGFASNKDSVDASIRGHENYIKKRKEGLITAGTTSTDNIKTNKPTINEKQKWDEKQLYGYFKQQICEISHEKTWTWLRKGNLNSESESLLTAAENAIRTNYIKAKIENMQQNSKCRFCGDRNEITNVNHILEFSRLA